MIVIGLTGRARTGKDTVANHIAEKYGFGCQHSKQVSANINGMQS